MQFLRAVRVSETWLFREGFGVEACLRVCIGQSSVNEFLKILYDNNIFL